MLKKLVTITLIFCINLQGTMKLVSPAFSHNEAIPAQYTCDGTNMSPALGWSDAPDSTRSFALIVDDPDAQALDNLAESPSNIQQRRSKAETSNPWVHWILFNIPVTISYILENTGSEGEEVAFMQGSTDFNNQTKWSGPCPPKGIHHYHFTLYALDTMLNLPAGATKEQLLSAMHGHILEQTTLIGTYKKQ